MADPRRTCVGCRLVRPQSELVRVVRRPDGRLATGRGVPGRGAWLCRGSVDCLDRARRRRAFGWALRAPVAEEEIERLRAELAERARIEGPSSDGGGTTRED